MPDTLCFWSYEARYTDTVSSLGRIAEEETRRGENQNATEGGGEGRSGGGAEEWEKRREQRACRQWFIGVAFEIQNFMNFMTF